LAWLRNRKEQIKVKSKKKKKEQAPNFMGRKRCISRRAEPLLKEVHPGFVNQDCEPILLD